MTIREWQKEVYRVNVEKGFQDEDHNIGLKLMLAVGELAEALEEIRAGHSTNEMYFRYSIGSDKPEGFGIELADAVIRIMNIAEAHDVDLEQCIELKHAYNQTRAHKHGKAF